MTQREAEVLNLAASGQADSQIAASLFISTRTVQKHMENIRSKLNVESRSAAVAQAFYR